MLIDFQVTLAPQRQAESPMLGDLLEHVIVESDAGRDRNIAARIKVDGRPYLGLVGVSFDACNPV